MFSLVFVAVCIAFFPGSAEKNAKAGPERAGVDTRDLQPQLAPLSKRHLSRQPGGQQTEKS